MHPMTTAAPAAQPRASGIRHPRHLAQLALLAIVGLVALNAVAWLLPLVSEYDLIGDTMSELALGRFGFILTGAFVLAGCGILGLAFAIRQLTRGAPGSGFGTLLLAVYGAGAIVMAIFPTDRVDSAAGAWSQSTTGMIHLVTALISFLCVLVAMFLLTHWTLRRAPRWQSRWHWWLALFPSAALPLFLGQSGESWMGLIQRLLVGVVSTWLVLLALDVRAIVADQDARPAD